MFVKPSLKNPKFTYIYLTLFATWSSLIGTVLWGMPRILTKS